MISLNTHAFLVLDYPDKSLLPGRWWCTNAAIEGRNRRLTGDGGERNRKQGDQGKYEENEANRVIFQSAEREIVILIVVSGATYHKTADQVRRRAPTPERTPPFIQGTRSVET